MQNALVTGATKGIGRAIADRLAADGYHCYINARSSDDVARVAAELNEVHGSGTATGIAADVSTEAGRRHLADHIRALALLVNNAGTNIRKGTLEYTIEDYRRLMAVNLESAWALCRAFHGQLKVARNGNIVNIASVAGLSAVRSSTAAYAMTKAGMEQMARFLAADWGPDGIRVNCVSPWYVRTPLAEKVLQDEAKREKILSVTPLGRVGEPEDIANAVAFLASEQASWITGVNLPVDGGFMTVGI